MKYSPTGSSEILAWEDAARMGGCVPEDPRPGELRSYRVDAWVEDDDGGAVENVSHRWLSELPEGVKRLLLKKLGLPVKKAVAYRGRDGRRHAVSDLLVADVWDGWCNVLVRLADAPGEELRVHSMHLAEMNKG